MQGFCLLQTQNLQIFVTRLENPAIVDELPHERFYDQPLADLSSTKGGQTKCNLITLYTSLQVSLMDFIFFSSCEQEGMYLYAHHQANCLAMVSVF
jgi:hypothetical protein